MWVTHDVILIDDHEPSGTAHELQNGARCRGGTELKDHIRDVCGEELLTRDEEGTGRKRSRNTPARRGLGQHRPSDRRCEIRQRRR
jgi:hypothetical protein